MIKHHAGCTADYPEKPVGEKPQQITREIVDGFYIDTCSDCGAFESNLPAEDDPYWEPCLSDGTPLYSRRKPTRQERLQGLADSGCDTWAEYRGER